MVGRNSFGNRFFTLWCIEKGILNASLDAGSDDECLLQLSKLFLIMCCTVRQYVENGEVLVFPFSGENAIAELAISYNKERYLSKTAQDFIALAKERYDQNR